MKARLGVVLFGIGVLCLVVAAGLAFYVAPTVTKLPYDLRSCDDKEVEGCLKPSVAVASNAKFFFAKGSQLSIETGDLAATTQVEPRADVTAKEMTGDLKDKAVVWDVFGWVEWGSEDVSQYSAELALDRDSAAAANWDGQFLQTDKPPAPSDVSFAGQTYKFPFHTAKKTYQYFDRDLRAARPILFDGTEKIQGVDTYRFKQVIENQDLNMPAEKVEGLLGQFAKGATSGKVMYSNTRTLWVEPVSGNFVKVREQQKKQLVPDTGTAVDLLDADFAYNDETIKNSIDSATATRDKLQLVSRNLPLGVAVLGALALIIGLLLFLSGRRDSAAARHRADDDLDTDSGVDEPVPAEDEVVADVPAPRQGERQPERA